jgi:predicted nucleotidyltransferase
VTGRDDAALLRLLIEHDVPFVVIGGWAVITHGYVRFTKDVDVLIPDAPLVVARVAAALESVHAVRLGGVPVTAQATMPASGWQVDTDLGRLDVLPEGFPPLDFESVHAAGLTTEIDGVPIRVAGLGHLAAFKRMAGRPHDLQDLDELEALHGPLPHVALPLDE